MKSQFSGPKRWYIKGDLLGAIDYHQSHLAVILRSPALSNSTVSECVGHLPPDITPERVQANPEAAKRESARHMAFFQAIYVHGVVSSALVAGSPSKMPVKRISTLDEINAARKKKGRGILVPYNSSTDVAPNLPTTYIVKGGTKTERPYALHPFDSPEHQFNTVLKPSEDRHCIALCRETHAPILPDFKEFACAKQNLNVAKFNGADLQQVKLGPNYYEADEETWVHRAIRAQAAFTQSTRISNPCASCPCCFMNACYSETPLNAEMASVLHKKTPAEFGHQLLVASSTIFPCYSCRIHYGWKARFFYYESMHKMQARYINFLIPTTGPDGQVHYLSSLVKKPIVSLEDTVAIDEPITSFLEDGETWEKSLTEQDRQKIFPWRASDNLEWKHARASSVETGRVVQDVLKHAMTYAAEYPGKPQRKQGVITPMGTKSMSLRHSDELMRHVFHASDLIGSFGTWHKLNKSQYELMSSLPHIVAAYALQKQKNGIADKSMVLDLAGSALFPPDAAKTKSFTNFLHQLQNETNGSTGRKIYHWDHVCYRKYAFLMNEGDPASLWPIIISDALALAQLSYVWKTNELSGVPTDNDAAKASFAYLQEEERKVIKAYNGITELSEDVKQSKARIEQDIRKFFSERWPTEALSMPLQLDIPHYEQLNNREASIYEGLFEMLREIEDNISMTADMRDGFTPLGINASLCHIQPRTMWRAMDAVLEAIIALATVNQAYNSLVDRLGPVPIIWRQCPHRWLIEQMWDWYAEMGRLDGLVQNVLCNIAYIPETHTGSDINWLQSGPRARVLEGAKLWSEYQNKPANERAAGMSREWMISFFRIFIGRLTITTMQSLMPPAEKAQQTKAESSNGLSPLKRDEVALQIPKNEYDLKHATVDLNNLTLSAAAKPPSQKPCEHC